MSNSIGNRELTERDVIRIGRSLRRISRTTRDLMRVISVTDEDVKISRKKRKPTSRVARKEQERSPE